MKKLSAFLGAMLTAVVLSSAQAQQNKSQITTSILNNLPDNGVGAITPSIMRTTLDAMVNSWQQFSAVNAQTVTTYQFQVSDYGQLVTFNNASATSVTLPQAIGSFSPYNIYVKNVGAGTVTITPTTSTINGASSFALAPNQSIWVVSDGVNYQVWNSVTVPASFGTQNANTVFAGPSSGGAAFPSFRTLLGVDLPLPSASSLGGIESIASLTHNWISFIDTSGVPHQAQPAFADISGTAAASQLPTPTPSTLGGVESIAAVSHNWINSINNSGAPQLSQPACADVSNASVYCTAILGQLPGTATNDSATAGNIGEYISSVIATGSATSLASTTAKNITSISLTAGDWDVSANCSYNGAGSVSVTLLECSISGNTGVVDQTNGRNAQLSMVATVPAVSPGWSMPVQTVRFSLATTTTIFMVSQQTFAVGTLSGWGILQARRAR